MECESNQNLSADVELNINGKQIELNNFVENFMAQTLMGMVRSLRGVDDIDSINVKITKKA